MCSKNSRLLRISSKDRAEGSLSRYNILFTTNDSDLHQINKVMLKSAIIPNTQYNITASNNTLRFPNDVGGSSFEYVVPIGQYTTTTLITELQNITGLTLTQSALTHKLTFTFSGGNFSLFSDLTVNPMAGVLGILVDAVSVSSYTCTGFPDLKGLTTVYISSQTLSNHSAMIATEKQKQNVFCNIPMDVPFGSTKVMEEDETTLDYSIFNSHKNISSIDIKLLDEKNNTIDLNGADWVLVFRVYA